MQPFVGEETLVFIVLPYRMVSLVRLPGSLLGRAAYKRSSGLPLRARLRALGYFAVSRSRHILEPAGERSIRRRMYSKGIDESLLCLRMSTLAALTMIPAFGH